MGALRVLPVDAAEEVLWWIRLRCGVVEPDVHLTELSYDLDQVTYPSMPASKGHVVSNGKKMWVPPWMCRVSFTLEGGGVSPVSCSRWFVPCVLCSVCLSCWKPQLFSYLN